MLKVKIEFNSQLDIVASAEGEGWAVAETPNSDSYAIFRNEGEGNVFVMFNAVGNQHSSVVLTIQRPFAVPVVIQDKLYTYNDGPDGVLKKISEWVNHQIGELDKPL